jgi:uncharacterized protein with GYD domain
MATYMVLVNFTDQGVRNFKDTTKRAEAIRDMAKKLGVSVKDIYWTLGAYDAVQIHEAPNDEAIAALLASVGALGNIRTQTLRAFSESEMKAILSKV